MNFLQKFLDFVVRPTHSRTMGILIFLVLVAAVSLTVYVAQQQQQLRQRAEQPLACQNIDNVPDCNFQGDPACETEGARCKIDRTIFECKKQ